MFFREENKKLKEFENKLLDDLTNLRNKYNIYPVCLNKETDLDYLKSFLEFIEHKRPDFFNKILDYFTSPAYYDDIIRRLLYTFSHNPQFMINFLNFLDSHSKPSVEYFKILLTPKYKDELRIRFYERIKEKEKRLEFSNLLVKKCPDLSEEINNLFS